MTEIECIDVLKKLAFLSGKKEHEKCEKAIEMAIQALEEIQQYRASGTVEDYWKLNEMCKDYSAIGTIDEFKALKEKNEPKKLKHDVCPNCSTNNDIIIKHLGNPQAHKIVSCWNCGQALDWSE